MTLSVARSVGLMCAESGHGGVVEGSSMPQVFIPQLIELWRAGMLPFERLVEHRNLDESNDVFAGAFDEGDLIKPVLCMP